MEQARHTHILTSTLAHILATTTLTDHKVHRHRHLIWCRLSPGQTVIPRPHRVDPTCSTQQTCTNKVSGDYEIVLIFITFNTSFSFLTFLAPQASSTLVLMLPSWLRTLLQASHEVQFHQQTVSTWTYHRWRQTHSCDQTLQALVHPATHTRPCPRHQFGDAKQVLIILSKPVTSSERRFTDILSSLHPI